MQTIKINDYKEMPHDYTGVVEYPHRTVYYLNGELHRSDGPAIEHSDGTKLWLVNGVSHRTNGPSSEYANGNEEWCINGKRHRLGGPAHTTKRKKEYWVDGKKVSKQQHDLLYCMMKLKGLV